MEINWKLKECEPDSVQAIALQTGFHPAIARAIVLRQGCDPETVDTFLNPTLKQLTSPLELPDMAKAIAKIWEHILAYNKIVIFGDYDLI
jgi:single-stranded-DNA-specific exonuclease